MIKCTGPSAAAACLPTNILPRVIITYGACARGGGRRRLVSRLLGTRSLSTTDRRDATAIESHVINFTFDLPAEPGKIKMDALSAAYDSDGSSGEETAQKKDEILPIDVEKSSSILSRLKEKFPFNSAPAVPFV